MIPLIYHPIYSQLPLPEGHRYPINKYQLLHSAVEALMDSEPLWKSKFEVFQPAPVSVEQVKQVHDSEYVDLLVSGNLPAAKMRRIGFPWSQQLIERTLYSSGGTCLAAEMAIESGLAIHLSGGYHHAHHDFGSGFCLLNDLVFSGKTRADL